MDTVADVRLEPSGSRARVALVALLSLLVCGLALVADRTVSGDVYLLLATGKYVSQHGYAWHDPFPTIAQGHPWSNQQWLAELIVFRVTRAAGLTGLSLLYAILLALPLLLLLWQVRKKSLAALVAGSAVYFTGSLAIIHPRAAGFTLLAFTLLTVCLLRAYSPGRSKRILLAVPVLFALWANLHAGFLAGLGLIALVGTGLAVDRVRGLPGSVERRTIAILGLVGAASFAATFATPLGPAIWSYVASFRNPAIHLATQEWEPAYSSLPWMIFLAIAASFAGWLFVRAPQPRPLTPAIVAGGFLLLAASSVRNVIFVAPAIFLLIAAHAPEATARRSLRPALTAAAAALALVFLTFAVLGPLREPAFLKSGVAQYALSHPPKHGRIGGRGGIGSYLLWRSPRTPIVVDGQLEHFTPAELRGAYGLTGGNPRALRYVRRWKIGAMIITHPPAARLLQRHGFVVKYWNRKGIYLVRRSSG